MRKVSGFTIVRNAVRLSYPFLESVRSALPLCDEFFINCGVSDDSTRELCALLEKENPDKVRILDTVWETQSQAGGFQLKSQSDRALAACQGRWCLYLQADEVFHEKDYPAIRHAMGQAESRPDIDGLVFEYRHFYGSYAYEIQGRNWYRREVRLFKNGRGIEAFRDAQGFRKNGERLKVFPANARVFHYGYVRTPHSLGTKANEMARWWGEKATDSPADVQLHRHVGLSLYRGTHPKVMAAHLQKPNSFDPKTCPRKWDKNEFKNALTLLWESFFPFRLGEFRNYEIVR
jgi:hypothetical protein